MLYPKTTVFIHVALVCVVLIFLLYVMHGILGVCVLGYGHYGQMICGYLLVGPNYYKPLPSVGDDMGDEEELELANENTVAV